MRCVQLIETCALVSSSFWPPRSPLSFYLTLIFPLLLVMVWPPSLVHISLVPVWVSVSKLGLDLCVWFWADNSMHCQFPSFCLVFILTKVYRYSWNPISMSVTKDNSTSHSSNACVPATISTMQIGDSLHVVGAAPHARVVATFTVLRR